MSYDANAIIAEDSVLARLSPITSKKHRLDMSVSKPTENDVRGPSTDGSQRLKRKRESEMAQTEERPAAEEDHIVTEANTTADKQPKVTGDKDQAKENTSWYKGSYARKLVALTRTIWENHQRMLIPDWYSELGSGEVDGDNENVFGEDVDHCLNCIARQQKFWKAMKKIQDQTFKARLLDVMHNWTLGNVFRYWDLLGLAYLSVLERSQAEGAAALKAAQRQLGNRDISQDAQRRRDALDREIRFLETGEGVV